ncbi:MULTISPECIES: I78 family peptidase inhibitor [Sphingomonas]|jgi:hypothetical protein|uniref:Peptidase inhibitor I78 family protein n=3 Tax=Sphingomonas paucimobilis TaxID=13689 RepID=A0A411LN67_SPHPI|nr:MULTISPECIES: I78 family peptidase inhibitor [Sphingomonas]MBQ1478594.1 hypothetical protein [Sphingomonas sp.]MCM3679559.1 I78 family peptidase inhibitor [Sphingomonas paucimobilis]MDG5971046.1 hypothetical protein [Sphingomonas paucimobilis]NNG59737.1 hypothetical protein [Sphingomonas paucimobilis]QBE93750.1 hypothetical protein DRN02_018455 [Sphingomonas paucimobilis]
MKMIAVSALSMALGLCACASGSANQHSRVTSCRPDAAATLVGQLVPDDSTILRRTGGTTVRRIAPGDPTTKDYRIDRITVTIADNRVVAAACG